MTPYQGEEKSSFYTLPKNVATQREQGPST